VTPAIAVAAIAIAAHKPERSEAGKAKQIEKGGFDVILAARVQRV